MVRQYQGQRGTAVGEPDVGGDLGEPTTSITSYVDIYSLSSGDF
jgi:hypothetical protein